MERPTENYKVERDWRFDLIVRQQPDPKRAETAGAMRKRQRPRGGLQRRPDVSWGSKRENLGMSKCFPLFLRQRTSPAEVLGKIPLQIRHCETVSLPAQPHQRAGVDLWEARKCGSGLQA